MRSVSIRARFDLKINIIRKRVQRFLEFSFPLLESAVIHGNVVTKLRMEEMFRRCPKLRRIVLVNFTIVFSPGLKCQFVESIKSDKCSVESFGSLFRQTPQLQEFVITSLEDDDDFRELMAILIVEKPSIERLVIIPSTNTIDVRITEEDFDALSRFQLIRYLAIRSSAGVTAQQIGQLITSMNHVEVMKLDVAYIDRAGIVALIGFRWIRVISIKAYRQRSIIDDGLIELFGNRPRLEKVELGYAVGRAVAIAAVMECRHLKHLRMFDIKDIGNDEEAAEFVRSLANFPQRQVLIEIELSMSSVWNSEAVRNELEQVNEAAGDRSIQITLLSQKVELTEFVDVQSGGQSGGQQWCVVL